MIRMWKKNKGNDYKMIDKAVAQQYIFGGTDMWVYRLSGAYANKQNSEDKTFTGDNDNPFTIGDLVLGETVYRKYDMEAIAIPAVYQIQDATPDYKIPGIFFNFNTMDITVHYNMMIQYFGRKIIAGDVIELPNLRDTDILGEPDKAMNKFYVVQDGFRTADGYSVTWSHHIYKLRVKPLTDSPEFADLLKDNEFADQSDPNNQLDGDTGLDSNYIRELELMNKIIQQADNEAPYIHWTNEHIYDPSKDTVPNLNDIPYGYELPVNPVKYAYYIKTFKPLLYIKDKEWDLMDVEVLDYLPDDADDGEFVFIPNMNNVSGYSLYQYEKADNKFFECVVDKGTELVDDADIKGEFYVRYQYPVLYRYENDTWTIVKESSITGKINSSDIVGNLYVHDDNRPKIPPARGTVPEGTEFPDKPKDGMYFYRTDYKPISLWQYHKKESKWTMFDYGGRLPWTGSNIELTNYTNDPDKVNVMDVIRPNTKYRIDGDE